MKRGGIIALALILASGPALAEAPALLTADQAAQRMRDLGLPALAALDLPPPQPAPMAQGSAHVEMADLQAALTQLAILSGANDHLPLIKAQQGPAIYLRQGQTTLPELAELLASEGQDGLQLQNGRYHLTRPLIIWSDASLALRDESLDIDRAAGAFVISFGDLRIDAARLAGTASINNAAPDFAPFLLVAGQGTLWINTAQFHNLGMADTKLFAGITVMTRGLIGAKAPVAVLDSEFQGVARLALIGTDHARIERNRLDGMLLIEAGQDQLILSNDIRPKTGTGIRITDKAKDVILQANLVQQGTATGIASDRGSAGLVLRANLVAGNAGDGISLSQSPCARVSGNLVLANGAVGLRLQAQTGLRAEHNAFLDNGTAAIDLRGQTAITGTTLLAHNLISGNREGLRGAGIGSVLLTANRLEDQLPRLFGGEFASHLPAYLTQTQQGDGGEFRIALSSATSPADTICKKAM
jgi:hypothetical protein